MSKKSQLHLIMTLLRERLAPDQQGATAIEYALIASGVGAAVAATVYNLGSTTQGLYAHLSSMFFIGYRSGRSPAESSFTPSASASRCPAEPGARGFCCLGWGAQPDSQTISNVARMRLSGSEKRSP